MTRRIFICRVPAHVKRVRRERGGEHLGVVQDGALDELVEQVLRRHLRAALAPRRQQRGPEADGQVPRVHHVVLAVLRQAARTYNLFFVTFALKRV